MQHPETEAEDKANAKVIDHLKHLLSLAEEHKITSFLAVYACADGASGNGGVIFTNQSVQMMGELQMTILDFGSSVLIYRNKGNNVIDTFNVSNATKQ